MKLSPAFVSALLAFALGSSATRAQAPADNPPPPPAAPAAASTTEAPPIPSGNDAAASDDTVVLNPFEVSADRNDNGYVAGNAISATRISTGINDLPFTITAFTPQFIADTGAVNLMDIVNQSAGVKTAVNNNTQGNAVFSIRGFVQTPERNGFNANQLTNNYVDASVIERVEVVKGPSSLLYGAISPGGTVNYITKQAEAAPFSELHAFVGSYNLMGVTVDENLPLLPNKLLFRFVGTDETVPEYTPNAHGRTLIMYPTFKWIVTPNVAISADYQGYQERQTAPIVYLANTDLATPQSIVNAFTVAGNPAGGSLLANKTGPAVAEGVSDVSDPGFMGPYPGLPNNFQQSDNHDGKEDNLKSLNFQVDLKFGNHWSGRIHMGLDDDYSVFLETGHATLFIPPPNSLVFSGGAWSVSPFWNSMTAAQQTAYGLAFAQQAVNNLSLLETTNQNGTPSPAIIDRAPRVQEQWVQGNTYQAETVGVYNYPSMKLQLLGGVFYDHVRYNVRTTQNKGNAASPFFRDWDVDPASPTYYENVNEGIFNGNTLTTVNTWSTSTNSDKAAYALLNASFFQERLFVVGGARYNQSQSDVYDHVAHSASPGLKAHYTTPQGGFGFKVTPDVMLYASYSESYTLSTQPFLTTLGNINGIPTAVPTTATAPTIGKGEEAGIKAGLLNNKLNATLSVYQIEETNVLQQLNENIQGTGVVIWSQGAEQRGRGLELTTTWAVLPNWQIIASGSEEDIRNITEPFGLEYYIGQNVGYTAKTQGNLWTRYDLQAVKGLWFGAGVDYTGKSAGDPRNVAYYLPSFTLYSAAVGYNWTAGKARISTVLNAKNLGNTAYKPSPNFYGEPRRVMVSMTVHL